MFNSEFFPTPASLIDIAFKDYLVKFIKNSDFHFDLTKHNSEDKIINILDPSAGKGDLLKYFINKSHQVHVHVCEIEFELQSILHNKGYKLVADDFLTYIPDVNYDLIVMNPPFSNGDQHLLHAWKIADNTDIICILNAETILNPYSKHRKLLLNIINEYGTYEIIERPFENAERKTNVDVAIVKLYKRDKRQSFNPNIDVDTVDFSLFKDTSDVTDVAIPSQKISDIVDFNERVKTSIKPFFESYLMFKMYLDNMYGNIAYSTPDYISSLIKLGATESTFTSFCEDINKATWKELIKGDSDIYDIVTSKVIKKIDSFIEIRQNMKITKESVSQIVNMLFLNRMQYMKEGLLDTFELMTSYDKKNKIHWEGWKTNSAYKVNKRVILPVNKNYWADKIELWDTSKSQSFDDIDKVMCFLTGHKFSNIVSMKSVLNGQLLGGTYESEFFSIRTYKKGTVHITFKNLELLEKFNLLAARDKNWLPEPNFKQTYESNKQYVEELKELA